MKRLLCAMLAVLLLLPMMPGRAEAANKKLIAFTFDDGPGPHTTRLLDGLDELGAKVTFFMVGNRVSDNIDTVRRAYDAGHQIACHSWDHEELTGLSSSALSAEFTKSYAAMDKACGKGTRYATRAPYGSANSRVRNAVGTPFFYWSVDTRDWETLNADRVYSHIMSHASDGAILLLHDIHGTSVTGALRAMKQLKKQGYEFVTLNELFRRRGVKLVDGEEYYQCSPTGKDLGPVKAPKITYTPESKGLKVTITARKGEAIYYNTTGKAFNQESKRYTGAFYVKPGTTVWAIGAYDLNGSRSEIVSKTMQAASCKKPEMQIRGGKLYLTAGTKGAACYYTTNGTHPNTSSACYNGAVKLAKGTVVTAISGGGGFQISAETRMYYSKRGNVFRDVFPDDWFCEFVDEAAQEGLMLGVGDNRFAPRAFITRGQFVTLLYRMAGEPAVSGKNPFRDVSAKAYYEKAVRWAYQNGLVSGTSATTFHPERAITREEAYKIAAGYLDYLGITVPEGNGGQYLDRVAVSSYARKSLDTLADAGILRDITDEFCYPNVSANRAQALVLLMRLREYAAAHPAEAA